MGVTSGAQQKAKPRGHIEKLRTNSTLTEVTCPKNTGLFYQHEVDLYNIIQMVLILWQTVVCVQVCKKHSLSVKFLPSFNC